MICAGLLLGVCPRLKNASFCRRNLFDNCQCYSNGSSKGEAPVNTIGYPIAQRQPQAKEAANARKHCATTGGLAHQEPNPKLQPVLIAIAWIDVVPALKSHAKVVAEPVVHPSTKVNKVFCSLAEGQRITSGHKWDYLVVAIELVKDARRKQSKPLAKPVSGKEEISYIRRYP